MGNFGEKLWHVKKSVDVVVVEIKDSACGGNLSSTMSYFFLRFFFGEKALSVHMIADASSTIS